MAHPTNIISNIPLSLYDLDTKSHSTISTTLEYLDLCTVHRLFVFENPVGLHATKQAATGAAPPAHVRFFLMRFWWNPKNQRLLTVGAVFQPLTMIAKEEEGEEEEKKFQHCYQWQVDQPGETMLGWRLRGGSGE